MPRSIRQFHALAQPISEDGRLLQGATAGDVASVDKHIARGDVPVLPTVRVTDRGDLHAVCPRKGLARYTSRVRIAVRPSIQVSMSVSRQPTVF